MEKDTNSLGDEIFEERIAQMERTRVVDAEVDAAYTLRERLVTARAIWAAEFPKLDFDAGAVVAIAAELRAIRESGVFSTTESSDPSGV